MEIVELSPKNNQTIAGSWIEKMSGKNMKLNAGGCHLHPNSKTENPIYKLVLYNSANVAITLRRPVQLWRKNIAADCV